MLKRFIFICSCLIAISVWAAIPQNQGPSFPEGEKLIYGKFLASFRKGDLTDMVKQKKLLEENYPQSAHLDNAYYLIGAYEYQQDHLGEALRAFDKVVNQFPQSSKRSTSLFAMGMTYRKLNLMNQAESVFNRVLDLYPGSPEAHRAQMEIKLTAEQKANLQAKKKAE